MKMLDDVVPSVYTHCVITFKKKIKNKWMRILLNIDHMFACRAIRWYVSTDMNFFRESEIGIQQTDGRFHTNIETAGDISDVDLGQLQADLEAQLDRFTNLGSGWTLARIMRFTLHIAQFRPLAGSSYIPTPEFIKNKKAVVNVKT
jgi:hypothetical protein